MEPNLPIGVDPDAPEEELVEMRKNLSVANTYITDANFLFVTLETKHGYNLYQFDLEQLDESIKDDGPIKAPQHIFSYTKDEVKELVS